MIELAKKDYNKSISLLETALSDKVFAYAILEGNQDGKIYVDNQDNIKNALFWHLCGYAIAVGEDEELKNTVNGILNGTSNYSDKAFILQGYKYEIGQCKNIRTGNRLVFRFNTGNFHRREYNLPAGYNLEEINVENIDKIEGYIKPSYFWGSNINFLNKGIGYCVLYNNEIASYAYSAFIGNAQIDIAVETMAKYRKHGLGKLVASKLIDYCVNHGFVPVWGCVKENRSSIRMAQELGFEMIAEHIYYTKLILSK
jgi:GNAT superfamily N-acetyltransferase